MTRAVVFAYHDVGVRCLSVLLSQGIRVSHVYTHADDPDENIWFGSVEALARSYDLPVTIIQRGDDPDLQASVAAEQPDFLFSFYYRFMLPPALLALAKKGAYNMHGSLLPKYRGRVPINWAIIHGERETGATLHEMVAKPDAGGIIDQQVVPILINDTALDVFRKATVAAEMVLSRALPSLRDGSTKPRPQDLHAGGYFSGRKPEDGRIDLSWSAERIHNLVRAVAPPYPGAFCEVNGKRLEVLGTLWTAAHTGTQGPARLELRGGHMVLQSADGGLLRISRANYNGHELTPSNFNMQLGAPSVPL